MALLVNNDVTERVLTMPDALEVLESAFRQTAEGETAYRQLSNVWFPSMENGDAYRYGDQLGAMATPPRVAIRVKSDIRRKEDGREVRFAVEPGQSMRFVLLFDATDGDLLALLNDRELQRTRVGGTAGLACKYLAREDATTVGMLGAGGMARTHARAFAAVRDLDRIRVYSPTPASREGYAEEMAAELGVTVEAVDDPATAVAGADVVSACTNADEPVVDPEWLEPGQFVVSVRGEEVGEDAHERFDLVATSANEPFTQSAVGDVDRSFSESRLEVTDHRPLAEVVVADDPRPDDDAIVFYDNRSISIQIVAICDLIYRRAAEAGLGVELPVEWFRQAGA